MPTAMIRMPWVDVLRGDFTGSGEADVQVTIGLPGRIAESSGAIRPCGHLHRMRIVSEYLPGVML
jgi:hypothetical protein